MTVWVGTSGWQYADWRGAFYPQGLPQRLWLEHYAEAFATVEVNNAFYRLPERSTFEQWRARTPDDCAVAVKMSRYLTHVRRLRDPVEPVERFLGRAAGLEAKLGPVLIQLPPNLPVDVAALDTVLACFPSADQRGKVGGGGKRGKVGGADRQCDGGSGVRVVVEHRHPSWWTAPVREVLVAHGTALAWAYRLGSPVTPLWRTADFGYVRFHEGRATPRPQYGVRALDAWLTRIGDAYGASEPVYVYFNNDHGAAAIHDAVAFAERARRRGFETTRTPGAA